MSYSFDKREKDRDLFIVKIEKGTHALAVVGDTEDTVLKFETYNRYPVHYFSFDLVTFDGIASEWTIRFYDPKGKEVDSTTVTGSGHENTNITYSSVRYPIATVSITPNIMTSSLGVTNIKWPLPGTPVPVTN